MTDFSNNNNNTICDFLNPIVQIQHDIVGEYQQTSVYGSNGVDLEHWNKFMFSKGDNIFTKYSDLRIPINDYQILKSFILFFIAPLVLYKICSKIFYQLLINTQFKNDTLVMEKNGNFYEMVQRTIRSLLVFYFTFYFVKYFNMSHHSITDPYLICLEYLLYHISDTLMLFAYKSKHWDMYGHHIVVVIGTALMMFYNFKGLFLISICGLFDVLSVFSFLLFICKNFNMTNNYYNFWFLVFSNLIIIFFRFPLGVYNIWYVVNNKEQLVGGAIWTLPNLFIHALDVKWGTSIYKLSVKTYNTIQKSKAN